MKLKDLIKLLQKKPEQEEEVQCAIWTKKTQDLLCVQMEGTATRDLLNVFVKHPKP